MAAARTAGAALEGGEPWRVGILERRRLRSRIGPAMAMSIARSPVGTDSLPEALGILRQMNTVSRWALASAMLLALSACGNKGPLVMPEKPVPVAVPADAEAQPAAESETEKTETSKSDGVPPVEIRSQKTTTAPTAEDEAAERALENGPGQDD